MIWVTRAGAKCSDCHGAHDILPLSDPDSKMAPGNRIATCASCHPGISENLVSFDPHANHHDSERSPVGLLGLPRRADFHYRCVWGLWDPFGFLVRAWR